MNVRGCNGKIAYATRKHALFALRRVTRRRGETASLTTYFCAHCGGFHLGRDPKRHGVQDRVTFDMLAKAKRYWQLVRGDAL